MATIDHTPLRDFSLEVSKGNITGHSAIYKFGRNSLITGTEIVWDESTASYTFPDSAATVGLSSDSTADSGTGNGARTVKLVGLDANFDVLSGVVTLNGATTAVSTGSYRRLHRMIVETVGTDGGNNSGKITAQISGVTVAAISTGFAQSLMSIFTIPNAKKGYLKRWWASMNKKQAAQIDVELFIREDASATNRPFNVKETMGIDNDADNSFSRIFDIPMEILGKSDMYVQGSVSTNGVDMDAGFDLILVDD